MLHIDEFPSFTTEAFANLLPEARKYGLSLTLAHQHVSQVERPVFDAIQGNAGTVIAFRLGARDAPEFCRQLTADIQAVIAADYIRNLREETIKGINGRLKQGLYTEHPLPGVLVALD